MERPSLRQREHQELPQSLGGLTVAPGEHWVSQGCACYSTR